MYVEPAYLHAGPVNLGPKKHSLLVLTLCSARTFAEKVSHSSRTARSSCLSVTIGKYLYSNCECDLDRITSEFPMSFFNTQSERTFNYGRHKAAGGGGGQVGKV